MAYTVFVSYSAVDRPLVHAIREAARPLNIKVYSYDQDVRPGVNLPQKLLSAITASDAVVVLLTEQAVGSPTVNQEIGAARQAGKLVIPIIEKGVDPARITMIQGLEYDVLDRADIGPTILRLTTRLGALKSGSDRAKWVLSLVVGGLFVWSSMTGKDDEDEDEEYEVVEEEWYEEWEEDE